MLLTEANLRLAFSSFDRDGSGLLSPDEIKAALGMSSDDNELIKLIISEIDVNSDGFISFPEFRSLMSKVLAK
jgi:calcium-dependent protein kinase